MYSVSVCNVIGRCKCIYLVGVSNVISSCKYRYLVVSTLFYSILHTKKVTCTSYALSTYVFRKAAGKYLEVRSPILVYMYIRLHCLNGNMVFLHLGMLWTHNILKCKYKIDVFR